MPQRTYFSNRPPRSGIVSSFLSQLSLPQLLRRRENIMSTAHLQRALTKSLRLHKTYSASPARQTVQSVSLLSAGRGASRSPRFSAAPRSLSRTTNSSSFHTMASLKSAAAAPPRPADHTGYDPEIKDIANYIHNYSVDSDLAVGHFLLRSWEPALPFVTPQPMLTAGLSLWSTTVRHSSLRLPRYSRLRSRGSALQGMHQAAGSHRPRDRRAQWHQGLRHALPA